MIETERLWLRPPEEADMRAFAALWGDPETMRWIGAGEPWGPALAEAGAARIRSAWQQDGFGLLAVVRRSDGLVLGYSGILAWDPATWSSGTRSRIGPRTELELGWTIRRDAWGRGYATEAALAARRWALGAVRPRRLISLIHPQNARSIRVAEKLGAVLERGIVTSLGIAAQLWSHPLPEQPHGAGTSKA